MSELAAAFSGAVGQIVGSFFTFPIDVVKIRLMASTNKSNSTTFQLLQNLFSKEGFGIYSRFPIKGLQQGSTRFTYYYLYSWLSKIARNNNSKGQLGFLTNLFIGYVVGVLNMIPSNPLSVVSTLMLGSTGQQRSIVDVGQEIYANNGLHGFYRGWRLTFMTALNPAIQNTIFDQIKLRWLLRRSKRRGGGGGGGGGGIGSIVYMTAFESFFLGAFAKAIATIVTFPWSRAKVLSAKGGTPSNDGAPKENETTMQILTRVYRKDGVAGVYQGLTPSLTKAVCQSAIMLLVREKVDEYSRTFILNLVQ